MTAAERIVKTLRAYSNPAFYADIITPQMRADIATIATRYEELKSDPVARMSYNWEDMMLQAQSEFVDRVLIEQNMNLLALQERLVQAETEKGLRG